MIFVHGFSGILVYEGAFSNSVVVLKEPCAKHHRGLVRRLMRLYKGKTLAATRSMSNRGIDVLAERDTCPNRGKGCLIAGEP